MAKPAQVTVQTISRPIRSDSAPRKIWPGTPTMATSPSAEAAAEITDGDPPEARRPRRPRDRPFDRRPCSVDDIRGPPRRRATAAAVGLRSDILRPFVHKKVERNQNSQGKDAQCPAGGPPTFVQNDCLDPRQDQDG